MTAYYVKRFFEILREEGPVEFAKASYRFLRRIIFYPLRLIIIKSDWVWTYYKSQIQTQVTNKTDADPFKIIWINPDRIQYVCGYKYIPDSNNPIHKDFEYFIGSKHCEVKDGDWDTHENKFEEHPRFIAIKQRYVEEVSWEKTDYFQNHIKLIEVEDRSFKYESREELLQECHEYEQLLYEIKENGYKTQREQGKLTPKREIGVGIGRNGKFLFYGQGSHRLSIAKVLELDKVPVIVRVRHTQWQKLRDEIRNNDLPDDREDLRDHPDLQDVIDA